MNPKKVVRPLRVQIYFGDDPATLEVYNDLKAVCDATGLSMSYVAYASFVAGFYQIKDSFPRSVGKPVAKARARK